MRRWREWLKVISAAFIGGVIATAGNLIVGWQLQETEREGLRESLRAGLRGEISALAQNQSHTDYLEGLLSELRKGKVWEPRGAPVQRSVVIYRANAPHIGLLAPCLVEEIAAFYQMVNWSARNEANLTGSPFQALEIKDKEV
jgi:hypothetical protein